MEYNTSDTLYAELTTTELKVNGSSEILYFENSSINPNIKNTSTIPMYILESYSEHVPIFQIVLDFIEITGGKF